MWSYLEYFTYQRILVGLLENFNKVCKLDIIVSILIS